MASVTEPVSSRGRHTRARVTEAGLAEFEALGWDQASIRGIARRAGVSVGTFYRYFEDQESLLRELARQRYLELEAIIELSPERLPGEPEPLAERCRARMRRNAEAILRYHQRAPGLHQVLTQRRRHDDELEALARRTDEALMRRATALFEAWGAPDPATTAFTVFHLLESSTVAFALEPAPGVSAESLLTTLADLGAAALPSRKERT